MKPLNILRNSAIILTACMAFTSPAYADCDNLGDNPKFSESLVSIQHMLEDQQYDYVLDAAKPLFGICQDSPALLYYTGVALREKGETVRAKRYFQESAAHIKDFQVVPSLTEKIWFAYYESEHPELSEAALEEKDAAIESLTNQLNAQKEKTAQLTKAVTVQPGIIKIAEM